MQFPNMQLAIFVLAIGLVWGSEERGDTNCMPELTFSGMVSEAIKRRDVLEPIDKVSLNK